MEAVLYTGMEAVLYTGMETVLYTGMEAVLEKESGKVFEAAYRTSLWTT